MRLRSNQCKSVTKGLVSWWVLCRRGDPCGHENHRGHQLPRRAVNEDVLPFWLGTGPFFGVRTCFANKRLAENMDLSPSRGRSGIFCPWSVVYQPRPARNQYPRCLLPLCLPVVACFRGRPISRVLRRKVSYTRFMLGTSRHFLTAGLAAQRPGNSAVLASKSARKSAKPLMPQS